MIRSPAYILGIFKCTLLASVVVALQPPDCALRCSQSSESNATCTSYTDLSCVCSNNVYADAVSACVQQACPDQSEEIAKSVCDTCKNSLDHCKAPANQSVTPPATEPKPTEPQTSTPDVQAAAVLVDPPAADPPATEPPATEPPATEPPAAEPLAAEPPAAENPAAEPTAAGLPLVKHLTKTTYRRPKLMTKPPKPCPCHGKKGSKHAVIIPGCAETTKFTKNHHRYRGPKHRRHRPKACTC